MTKEEIIEKLREFGITSENCYPKNSFIDDDSIEPVVGLYKKRVCRRLLFLR
jgi:hypothetical protein